MIQQVRNLHTQEPAANPKLMKACQDFESVFLSMLWKQMQKSTGTANDSWNDIAHEAVANKWAQTGGIGLAKVIYRNVANDPSK